MSVFNPAEAFDLFVAAYSHLERAALTGARRGELGGLPCLEYAGLEGEVTREVLTWGLPPEDVIRRMRAAASGKKHWLTVFTTTPQDDLPLFAAAGYRHRESEALLVRRLDGADLPPADSRDARDARVVRVARLEELTEMNAARGFQIFHPAELDDPLTHIFRLVENGRSAAWGTSLLVRPDVAYIANMYTLPECRRRGFARAVLASLQADAVESGARRGLLVSTHAGYTLYRSVGFDPLMDCLVLVSS